MTKMKVAAGYQTDLKQVLVEVGKLAREREQPGRDENDVLQGICYLMTPPAPIIYLFT
uniref:Uncharacterized protein n=1 Tax=Arion vulgaris TaxID=1028688 RepID=A0A0B7BIF8_9EUPU